MDGAVGQRPGSSCAEAAVRTARLFRGSPTGANTDEQLFRGCSEAVQRRLYRESGCSETCRGSSHGRCSWPEAGQRLSPGSAVYVTGVVAKPELNGKEGTLVAFDKEKGRWQVRLADGVKLLRAENLEARPGETAATPPRAKAGFSSDRP